MEPPSLKKPRLALRVWAVVLAVLMCVIAAGEYAAMRHGQELRCARPEMYLEEAIARKNVGDFPGAFTAWEKAIERGPKEPYVYKVLGDIHHAMGNWEKAIPAYEEALRLGSNARGVRMNLLACHLNLKQYDALVTAGRRFLDEGDPDPAYYRFLATACFRARKFGDAITYLLPALEEFPNDLRLMDLLRQSYEKTGQQAEADAVDGAMRNVESRLSPLGRGTNP